MNRVLVALLVVFGLLAASAGWFVSVGNSLVGLDENVNEAKAQVENVYQRRADLIPNLVNTVKGYAKHEAQVLEEVTKARASAGQVRINADNAEDVAKYEQAQGALTQALSRLMVVAEKYPELKADRNFLELQSQLEGTENRITIERQRFNQTTREYNNAIRRFPASFVAGFRGFHERPYFQGKPGTDVAPKVEF